MILINFNYPDNRSTDHLVVNIKSRVITTTIHRKMGNIQQKQFV